MTPYTAADVAALRSLLGRALASGGGRLDVRAATSERGLVAAARRHRVVSLLQPHLHRLDASGALTEELDEVARSQRMSSLAVVRDQGVALTALHHAGIRSLVVKGTALSAQVYGDFATRGGGDIDLLVAPSDVSGTVQALAGAGWYVDARYPRPGSSWAWRHTLEHYYELPMLSPTGTPVDVHWHLDPAHGALPPFEALWARRTNVEIGPQMVATLGPPDALAHSASHAARDDWRWLRSLADVHLLWRLVGGSARQFPRAQRATLAVSTAHLDPAHAFRFTKGELRWISRAERYQVANEVPTSAIPGSRAAAAFARRHRGATDLADVRRNAYLAIAHPSHLGPYGESDLGPMGVLVDLNRRRLMRNGREWRHA